MNTKKLLASILAVLGVSGGVIAIAVTQGTKETPAPVATQTTLPTQIPVATATPIDIPASQKTYRYKNGTYSVIGRYNSPEGSESIAVSITLTNDVITNATVTGQARDQKSIRYQNLFISGYKAVVIGKDINTLNLGVVSGSSLTPVGFNDALSQIKLQAKA